MNNENRGVYWQCPYDVSHRILDTRFHKHLIKCSRQHPKTTKLKCPINLTHIIDKEEYNKHLSECSSRKTLDLYMYKDEPVYNESPSREEPSFSAAECDSWDHLDVETYDPETYCLQNQVIRKLHMATKSERKEFRQQENKRFGDLQHKGFH